MIRTRYHGEASYKLIVGINHNVQLRIQLCLILKYLGLPRDLRQLLIIKVWFDCQSEVLRQERISLIPNDRLKFMLPILELVEKCRARHRNGRLARTVLGITWNRLRLTTMEMIMGEMDDCNNFPSILQNGRKLKKLKI
jgi:hypothetical protein